MHWLRARQISRGTDYRRVLIPERSLDQRRCGRKLRAATRILTTWSPSFLLPDKPTEPVAAGFGLPALVSCGFELGFPAPITILSGTWTVPDLNHSPAPEQFPNHLHTFFGLGFLDVHVEMTVDVAQNVTSLIRIHTGAQVALPVRPGDAISATLCLQTDAAGTAAYFLANETTSQTVNFTIETGFPPARAINAGVTRDSQFNGPPDPLARFGVVYFDELTAFATSGTPRLTDGLPTTMVDSNGRTLAVPQRLTDFTFKVIYRGG